MKSILLIIILNFFSVLIIAQENAVLQELEGKVEYISTQYIYVHFDNTEGLSSGDTLFVKKRNKYNPALTIEKLSSRSCATKMIKRAPNIGDVVFAFVEIEDTSVVKSAKDKYFPIKPDNTDKVVKIDTTEFIGFKKLDKGIYGRFSISSYSNISNVSSQVNTQNWRYSLSLNSDNYQGSRLSFSNYTTFRYRADDWNYVSANLSDALKVYDLSIKYDFNRKTSLLLGRKINRKVSNIGAIDGIQLETKYSAFNIGGVFGFRPDYTNYGFNSKLLQFGGYINRTDTLGKGTMENTISLFQQMNDLTTDRRFIYLQHNNSIVKNTFLFLSSEIDLFEKLNGNSKNSLRFTSLYLSIRYAPERWLSTSLSYDARKNVIYYETFKNYADQLAEDALRQGFRLRINLRPIKYVFASIYTGYRFREDDIKPTRNFGGSVTHSRIPYLQMSSSLSYINLSTNYLDGNIIGVRISKDLLDGFIYSTVGYRRVDYKFTATGTALNQDIAQVDLSFRLTKKYSFSISYEGTFENKISYSSVYANFTTRF